MVFKLSLENCQFEQKYCTTILKSPSKDPRILSSLQSFCTKLWKISETLLKDYVTGWGKSLVESNLKLIY